MNFNEIAGVLFLGIVSFGVLWFGWYKGFFRWNSNRPWNTPLVLKHVLIPFMIYFAMAYVIAPFLILCMKPFFKQGGLQIGFASWLNFFISALTLLALFIYWRSLNPTIRSNLWRNTHLAANYKEDLIFAFYAWCVSIPLVLFVSQFLESFVYLVFKVQQLPDQIAVYFVKMTFSDPFYFFLAILTVVFIAPLIEETLFRGFLQSFIRKHVGSKQAILITALCFSFFHFSPDQGFGNIPIIGSLFALALFLGFIYEKQGSLFASISLHSMFNAISILNLYFLGGIQSPL
jgi:membrane protease YdiL (CAAX protease family)